MPTIVLKYDIQMILDALPKGEYIDIKKRLCQELGWTMVHLNRVISTPIHSRSCITAEQLVKISDILGVDINTIIKNTAKNTQYV